jgi:hypothetical protein
MPRVIVPVTEVQPPKAVLTTTLAGNNNDITYTAVAGGQGGNNVRVRYVVSGANQPLSVVVEGFDITVNSATDGASAATSTGATVLAALQQRADVTQMVTVAHAAGNDGTGVIAGFAFANLTGGALVTAQPSAVTADSTNDHYFTGNDGQVELLVVSTDGSSRTVSVFYAPSLEPGVTIAPSVETIPAGATVHLGPFDPRKFNQNLSKDVYFDPSVSTTLTFRALRINRQG